MKRSNKTINDVFVIGGGASLKGFDFSRIDGFKIGANGCAYHSNSDILVSIDFNYIKRFINTDSQFDGDIYFAKPPFAVRGNDSVTWFTRKRCEGKWQSLKDDELGGFTSGYAAFAVALKMNPERIHLLGIDMKPNGWFHGDYAINNQKADLYQSWAKEFNNTDVGDIDVINYSPDSAVTIFRSGNLDDL